MYKKISFLFGAGAEVAYGLPQGDAFTRETLLNSNKELMEALSEFYKDNKIYDFLKDWISDYRGESVYSKEIGRQIIVKTISLLIRIEPIKIEKYHRSLKWIVEQSFSLDDLNFILKEEIEEELKSKLEELKLKETNKEREELEKILSLLNFPKEILRLLESPKEINQSEFKDIIKFKEDLAFINLISNKMQNYGILEKYFYTVINPKKYGPYNYWKLINYYWQAYFSIIIPMCEYSTKNGTKFFTDLNIEFDETKKWLKIKIIT